MSPDLYELISLAARYLFTLLGLLIVLRAFLWLLSDRAEKHRRLRKLPDAGMVGELVVLSGGPALSEGTVISVPWEGELGSVRSCDIYLPVDGVRRRHLSFSFYPGIGLCLRPFSGCEIRVNDSLLTCRTPEKSFPMTHGAYLRIGSSLLQLRLFAGLDPSGIGTSGDTVSAAAFAGGSSIGSADPGSGGQSMPGSAVPLSNAQIMPASAEPVFFDSPGQPVPVFEGAPSPDKANREPMIPVGPVDDHETAVRETVIFENPADPEPAEQAAATESTPSLPGIRKRRRDRWEADWSD